MTVVDPKGTWVNSFPLGDASGLEEDLSFFPVDLGTDVTVQVVERTYMRGTHVSFSKNAWLFMQGPDGRATLAKTFPDSFYRRAGGCYTSKALAVYAVALDGAPPSELVVTTRKESQDKCDDEAAAPLTSEAYEAYHLNAQALRFDAFSVAPKTLKAALAAVKPAW